MAETPDNYVACLTPPGRGAIASLGIRGPRAWTVVRELFERRRSDQSQGPVLPVQAELGRVWFGRLGEAGHSDEVVLAVRRSGPSPWLELHCHGGTEVVSMLLGVFHERGFQVCSWQELDGLTSVASLQSAAQAALAQAITIRTASILLDQYHGAFSQVVAAIASALRKGQSTEGMRLFGELAGQVSLGRHLTQPWRVVIAGAPNAGKSSLVNALAGYERSVVAPTPGTTRDVVTTTVAIDGWPVELADTAGWRTQADEVEQQGIDRARTALAAADLCIWLLDGSTAPIFPDARAPKLCQVINKVDLPAAWNWVEAGAIHV